MVYVCLSGTLYENNVCGDVFVHTVYTREEDAIEWKEYCDRTSQRLERVYWVAAVSSH